jgi:hypothetical protein
MKRWKIFVGFVLMLTVTSCSTEIIGEGNIIVETYSITTNVTKISVDDHIPVTVKYGLYKKVHVEGYENLLDYVKISATGGVIRIGMKPDYTYQNLNISAVVEMPTITGITATHAGNIEIDTFVNVLPTLALTTSGSGNITSLGKLKVGALSITMSNSGTIYLQGNATTQTVQLSGSGGLNSFDMLVNSSTITNNGTGNVFVQVKNDLDATIDSSGNISYKGYPSLTTNITGTGLLIDAN